MCNCRGHIEAYQGQRMDVNLQSAVLAVGKNELKSRREGRGKICRKIIGDPHRSSSKVLS